MLGLLNSAKSYASAIDKSLPTCIGIFFFFLSRVTLSQYHFVYGLNKLTSSEVSVYFIACFFPHIGENVVVVINVREEIRKFKNKVKKRTSQTATNDIFFLLAELVNR